MFREVRSSTNIKFEMAIRDPHAEVLREEGKC